VGVATAWPRCVRRRVAGRGYYARVPSSLTDAVVAALVPLDARALAESVQRVSQAYNEARFPMRWSAGEQAARLGFFLPRDLHKVARALRDVDLRGVRRVLDLGAGVGASAVGAVLAVRAQGVTAPLEVQLVEPDAAALAAAVATLARLEAINGFGPVAVRARRGDLLAGEGAADLVVLGQVLVEVGHGMAEAGRVPMLARLLTTLAERHLAPGGRILVVEPALRVTARRLQQVRGVLLRTASGEPRLHVVAPCPHDGACPLLAREGDWCHEDLAVDLPASLVPVARAAGLRWQGLTFARLVLASAPEARPPARVAAPPRVTKGKSAHVFCSGDGTLRHVERLDRHRSGANAVWDALQRGDAVRLSLPDADHSLARIGADARVEVWTPDQGAAASAQARSQSS
jgi:ribosomal protein RSM22 (predicted rRNA methylase)